LEGQRLKNDILKIKKALMEKKLQKSSKKKRTLIELDGDDSDSDDDSD
jgi:hypothetical protein